MSSRPEGDIVWLTIEQTIAFHDELLARHGGSGGIRDKGLLESALARPQHLFHYEEPSLMHLAAAYGFGIIKNHPFIDGNKRTGATAIAAFLYLNDIIFEADEVAIVSFIEGVAAGNISEEELGQWIEKNSYPVEVQ